jgi:succinoglycan biosynthesis transport protein ExoP
MHDNETTPGVITFRQVGQVLRGGWTLVLACVVLGVAAGGALSFAVPATYTSQADVSLSPVSSLNGSSSAKDISTATEINIAASTAVADKVAPLIKWPGAASALLNNVSVTSPLDSQVLQVSYSASTPAAAAAGANAFATAYLAYRAQTAQAGLQARLDRIGQRIAEFQKASDAKAAVIADPKSSQAQRASARAQQVLFDRQIQQLQDQQATIATTTVSAGSLVNRGLPPLGRDLPRTIFMLAGLLIGLVLGFTLTMLRNVRNARVRDAGDIEERFTVPVLESIPERKSSRKRPTAFGVLNDIDGQEADAYRSLAAKMTVGTAPSCRRLLLVATSDLHAASTPVSLAVTLAAQGQRVLLLGSQEAMTSACRLVSPDFADAGAATGGVQELLHKGGLRVLSFGDELSLLATLRSQGEFTLSSTLKEIDILLIDAMNVELASTSLALARLADEALVVVRAGETHVADIRTCLHDLRQVMLPVQGVVFLEPTRARLPKVEGQGAPRTPSTSLNNSVSSPTRG